MSTSNDPHALLVASLKAGELPADALHDLLREVTGYIRVHHTSFKEDADDIASEAILAAYEGIDQFRGDSLFFSWLCAIVNRKVAKHYRKRENTQHLDDVPEIFAEAKAIGIWQQQEREDRELFLWDLESALEALTENQRQVFHLRLQEQLPSKTVAQQLGINDANVRQILVRACRIVGQKLKEAGWQHLAVTHVKDVRKAYSTAAVAKITG